MANGKTICTLCNYVYDEKLGEPRQNILSAVSFEDLAEDWRCPECNSAKDMFQPCSCVSLPLYKQTCVAHLAVTSEKQNTGIDPKTSVGQLVAERSGRACVLEAHGIDYCCGGKFSLEEACRQRGVSLDEVMNQLAQADQLKSDVDSIDWRTANLRDLIEHIVSRYHEPLKRELPRIAALADKVARVHGARHPEMIEVRNVFVRFKTQLELHMQKEEAVLFPFIERMASEDVMPTLVCGSGVEHPIAVMTQEHDEAGEALGSMRQLTRDFAAPADACNSFKALLADLAEIESEMHQHVHRENSILFPRALALQCKDSVGVTAR
ncbi:MAG TPA: iron-sulfur cluster repair di-iron protein [Candidatus Obscuribacterales bacterium]